MKHILESPFLKICQSILSQNLTELEWADMESCDMFQEAPYVGGFESIENAFCFSVYDEDGAEYWFQLTLEEIKQVANGTKTMVDVYLPLD